MKSSLSLLKESLDALKSCKAYIPAQNWIKIKSLIDELQGHIIHEEMLQFKRKHKIEDDFQDTQPQNIYHENSAS